MNKRGMNGFQLLFREKFLCGGERIRRQIKMVPDRADSQAAFFQQTKMGFSRMNPADGFNPPGVSPAISGTTCPPPTFQGQLLGIAHRTVLINLGQFKKRSVPSSSFPPRSKPWVTISLDLRLGDHTQFIGIGQLHFFHRFDFLQQALEIPISSGRGNQPNL